MRADNTSEPDKIYVAAGAVVPLREGVLSQIATNASEISEAKVIANVEAHPERILDPLDRIDLLRSLLRIIEWDSQPDSKLVDLDAHSWAISVGLQDAIEAYTDALKELSRNDERHSLFEGYLDELTPLALTVLLKVQAQALL
jgi:hypothetical protein